MVASQSGKLVRLIFLVGGPDEVVLEAGAGAGEGDGWKSAAWGSAISQFSRVPQVSPKTMW